MNRSHFIKSLILAPFAYKFGKTIEWASMTPVYRYNVEDQLMVMLSKQISQEIDQEILRSLVDYA